MSAISDMLVDAVRALQESQDNPVLNLNGQDGADYPCVAGAPTMGRTLGIGGLIVDADLLLAVVLADFPDGAPNPKRDKIYYPGPGAGGVRYRLTSVNQDGNGAIAILALNSDKGV